MANTTNLPVKNGVWISVATATTGVCTNTGSTIVEICESDSQPNESVKGSPIQKGESAGFALIAGQSVWARSENAILAITLE